MRDSSSDLDDMWEFLGDFTINGYRHAGAPLIFAPMITMTNCIFEPLGGGPPNAEVAEPVDPPPRKNRLRAFLRDECYPFPDWR